MNVVILYLDAAGSKNAAQTLNKLSKRLGHEFEFRIYFWRSSLLEDSTLFSIALNQAIKADILVISSGLAEEDINATLTRWIQISFAYKRGTTSAVVTMMGPTEMEGGHNSPGVKFIKEEARKAGLAFFDSTVSENQISTKTGKLELPQNRNSITSDFASSNPYSHWGINE